MAGQTVLNLDTLTDRPVVIIGGQEYRLWSIDLLPPLDNHRVRKLLRRNDELALKEDLTDEEATELDRLFDAIVRIVLDAPAEIHEQLTNKQRAEIIRTFQMPSLDLLMKVLAAAQATPATGLPPTGETSPGDSPATTT
jgi:hypothetical protein